MASWAFGWFDRRRRPADVLPAQVSAYLELDLAPAPWERLQAWSFLHDLPEVQSAGGRPEPKLLLRQVIGSRLGCADDADFAADVQPWLGDRAGFAIMVAPDEPTWMTAIELIDTERGVATLKKWIGERDQRRRPLRPGVRRSGHHRRSGSGRSNAGHGHRRHGVRQLEAPSGRGRAGGVPRRRRTRRTRRDEAAACRTAGVQACGA